MQRRPVAPRPGLAHLESRRRPRVQRQHVRSCPSSQPRGHLSPGRTSQPLATVRHTSSPLVPACPSQLPALALRSVASAYLLSRTRCAASGFGFSQPGTSSGWHASARVDTAAVAASCAGIGSTRPRRVVFVTGTGGFIGYHAAAALSARGDGACPSPAPAPAGRSFPSRCAVSPFLRIVVFCRPLSWHLSGIIFTES